MYIHVCLFVCFRRNRDADDEDDEIPEWQWTVRQSSAPNPPSKPTAINVAIPKVPDMRYSGLSNSSSDIESPAMEEPPTPPINGLVSSGPETVLSGYQEGEEEEEEEGVEPMSMEQEVPVVAKVGGGSPYMSYIL